MGLEEVILVPLMVVIFIALDYAFWPLFVSIAGVYAIIYMLPVVAVEVIGVVKMLG